MSPDQLLREFLKATADPANRHLAARQFSPVGIQGLGRSGQRPADRQGGVHPDPVLGQGVGDHVGRDPRLAVRYRVFETGDGALPDPGPIELVQTPNGWRIDRLPNGVFLDWQQFQSACKRYTLYFVDPTGTTVVPDPATSRCRRRTW